jgi:hypothetical protein
VLKNLEKRIVEKEKEILKYKQKGLLKPKKKKKLRKLMPPLTKKQTPKKKVAKIPYYKKRNKFMVTDPQKKPIISNVFAAMKTPINNLIDRIGFPLSEMMTVLMLRYSSLLVQEGYIPGTDKWDRMIKMTKGDYKKQRIKEIRKALNFLDYNILGRENVLNKTVHYFNIRYYAKPLWDSKRKEYSSLRIDPQKNKLNLKPIMYKSIWACIDIPTDLDKCWIWMGPIFNRGILELYGKLDLYNLDGYTHLAHEIVWGCFNGPMNPDDFIIHTCRNRRCVNPNHMLISPYSVDTTLDMMEITLTP